MNTIFLIFLIIGLLLLEAMVDGYTFLSWKGKGKKYGKYHHRSQLFLLLGFYLLGKVSPDIISLGTLYLAGGYVLMRYGAFDVMYNSITGNTEQGTTSWFDEITAKYPILNHLLVRWAGFIGGVVLIVMV